MAELTEWYGFSARLEDTAIKMAQCVQMPLTEDHQVFGLALLVRTISNFDGVIILLQANKIVEARTLMRSCFENLLYAAGIAAEGRKFVDEMIRDDIAARRSRGEFLIERIIEDIDSPENDELRRFLRETNRTSGRLTPKTVADRGVLSKGYIIYSQASADAAHPTVTSLTRYIVETGGGLKFDLDPDANPEEAIDTISEACNGLLGTCYV
jgi:hypothetical protein